MPGSKRPSPRGDSLRADIVAITLVRVVVNTAHRMVYPFLPFLAGDLGVSLGSFSAALAIRSLLGVASPLLATISEKRGQKASMLLGLGAMVIGMALVGIWTTFPMLVVALLLVAVSKYLFDPAMQAFLGDQVRYSVRGRAVAFTEYSWSLAFLLGIPALSLLKDWAGWQPAFLILGGLGWSSTPFPKRKRV